MKDILTRLSTVESCVTVGSLDNEDSNLSANAASAGDEGFDLFGPDDDDDDDISKVQQESVQRYAEKKAKSKLVLSNLIAAFMMTCHFFRATDNS